MQINYEVKVEAMRAAAEGINTCVVSFQRFLTLWCTHTRMQREAFLETRDALVIYILYHQ